MHCSLNLGHCLFKKQYVRRRSLGPSHPCCIVCILCYFETTEYARCRLAGFDHCVVSLKQKKSYVEKMQLLRFVDLQ